jgi:glycosyltransferase involved in cell wall biosynthesis
MYWGSWSAHQSIKETAAKVKISLSMIVRNEGRTLERTLNSVAQYVDEIVIGLAGESTDNTEQIVSDFLIDWVNEPGTDRKAEWFKIKWNDHFADARNFVLEKCTGDWLLWLDGDDELIGGENLRSLPELNPQADVFYFGYDYGRDDDGTNHTWLWRERLLRASLGWTWRGRVHEVLGTEEPHQVFRADNLTVKHIRDGKITGPRNMRLLYKEIAETEPNPPAHLLVYLGNELAGVGQLDEAVLHWERYLKLGDWQEELYQVQCKIAKVYALQRRYDEAKAANLKAIELYPGWPDAFLNLGEIAFVQENWVEAIEWYKAASTKEPPKTTLIIDPQDYSWKPYVVVGVCYSRLGEWEAAIENIQVAYDAKPTEDLAIQLQLLRDNFESEKVLYAFMKVYEHLGRNDEWLKARELFKAAPKMIETHPMVQDAWLVTSTGTEHVDDPQAAIEYYKDNPGIFFSPEENMFGESRYSFPRMRHAVDVAAALKAKNILDIGCNDGFFALPLAYIGHRVDGVDLDPRLIAEASARAEKYGLTDKTSFTAGDLDTVMEWVACEKFYKYDLAIAFEIIEHIVDLDEFFGKLEQAADHIAITTPHLSWDRGTRPDWNKPEFKQHIRIFDLPELERLLTERGRIHNLYVEPWGQTGWIFADYQPRSDYVVTDGQKNINFLAPGTVETFGPRKLKKSGLGGSETALIRLAEEFAQLGHNVTIYGNIDESGFFNQVRYRTPEEWIPDVTSDLTVAWRVPDAANVEINTKKLVLWMHDTDAQDRLTPEYAERFDSIVVLSEWHKQHMLTVYPFLKPEQLRIIGNGVDKARFDQLVDREPNRVVYASSPDRGLDVILEHIWPKVVEAVPEAELHIYYGWESFDKAAARIPSLKSFKAKLSETLLANKNVIQHGRVDQMTLAKEMLRSSLWLYPTYFYETYCITAVEAQLAGLVPVTNRLGALNETVKAGVFIDGDVNDPEVQQHYVEAVIQMLQKPDDADLRSRIAKNAPALSWSEIARGWEEVLRA